MERFKKLTILHSNDLHGDFLAKESFGKTVGGVSMLSGYISGVKAEEPNTLYCIAGDMLQGSLIDTEFKGLSTIEIINHLNPDIVSLGNHEIDYGLGHLLLLERCASFPIVNANLFIRSPYTRLFQPHKILYVGGMKIMFIGIITSEVLATIKEDSLLGSLIDVEDAAKEVGKICNAYRTIDIDFTILLTHIGIEEDKHLASLLDPAWGIDVIIGGHSHTVMERPEKVNNILIAHAGEGSDQIGRFDILVDTDENAVAEYKWELVPVNSDTCVGDEQIEDTIRKYKNHTDAKYDRILCWLDNELTHPSRYQETELGNFFSDAFLESIKVDIAMVGSGSIRKKVAGPVITHRDLIELIPFEEKLYCIRVSGAQFKQMYAYMLRDEALQGEHTEFYQFSHGVKVEYDSIKKEFIKFLFLEKPIEDYEDLSICIQGYHLANFDEFFDLSLAEVAKNAKPVLVSTSQQDVIEEYLLSSMKKSAELEGRLVIH